MHEKGRDYWAKQRKQGLWIYMLKWGCSWGISTALLSRALLWWFRGLPNNWKTDLTISLIVFSLGGMLMSYFQWKAQEKAFRKQPPLCNKADNSGIPQ